MRAPRRQGGRQATGRRPPRRGPTRAPVGDAGTPGQRRGAARTRAYPLYRSAPFLPPARTRDAAWRTRPRALRPAHRTPRCRPSTERTRSRHRKGAPGRQDGVRRHVSRGRGQRRTPNPQQADVDRIPGSGGGTEPRRNVPGPWRTGRNPSRRARGTERQVQGQGHEEERRPDEQRPRLPTGRRRFIGSQIVPPGLSRRSGYSAARP